MEVFNWGFSYQPTGGFRPAMPTGTYPASHSTYHPYPGLSSNNIPSRATYNPYATSNHGAGSSASAHNGINGAVNGAQANSRRKFIATGVPALPDVLTEIRFKPSPFYRMDQPLHQLVICQGALRLSGVLRKTDSYRLNQKTRMDQRGARSISHSLSTRISRRSCNRESAHTADCI